jgi:hypothetical protein
VTLYIVIQRLVTDHAVAACAEPSETHDHDPLPMIACHSFVTGIDWRPVILSDTFEHHQLAPYLAFYRKARDRIKAI